MNKLDITNIVAGQLVNEIQEVNIEFEHAGKKVNTDISLKSLPYKVSEPLYLAISKKEDVAAKWISLSMVDETGKTFLTEKQVADNFTQSLAGAILNKILGLDKPKEDEEGK